jgi:NADH-quinone oxidoreductase subunit N
MGEAGSMDMVAMLGDVIPELVLVIGGVVTLLWAVLAPRRWQVGASGLALITIALAFGAAASLLPGLQGAERLTFADTYARDGVAVWSKLIILPATAVVIGLSVPWFRSDPRHGETTPSWCSVRSARSCWPARRISRSSSSP